MLLWLWASYWVTNFGVEDGGGGSVCEDVLTWISPECPLDSWVLEGVYQRVRYCSWLASSFYFSQLNVFLEVFLWHCHVNQPYYQVDSSEAMICKEWLLRSENPKTNCCLHWRFLSPSTPHLSACYSSRQRRQCFSAWRRIPKWKASIIKNIL